MNIDTKTTRYALQIMHADTWTSIADFETVEHARSALATQQRWDIANQTRRDMRLVEIETTIRVIA